MKILKKLNAWTDKHDYFVKKKAQHYFNDTSNDISKMKKADSVLSACDGGCGAACGTSCDCAGACS